MLAWRRDIPVPPFFSQARTDKTVGPPGKGGDGQECPSSRGVGLRVGVHFPSALRRAETLSQNGFVSQKWFSRDFTISAFWRDVNPPLHLTPPEPTPPPHTLHLASLHPHTSHHAVSARCKFAPYRNHSS